MKRYRELCSKRKFTPGKIWLYKTGKKEGTPKRWILNFPTKEHWKEPSKIKYLEKGLEKFVATYQKIGITSIAFPLLAAHNGGLSVKKLKEIMEKYLRPLTDIEVKIYEYNSTVPDDLYHTLSHQFQELDSFYDNLTEHIEQKNKQRKKKGESNWSKISKKDLKKIKQKIGDENIHQANNNNKIWQINQILRIPKVGQATVEKLFSFLQKEKNSSHKINKHRNKLF